MTVAVCSINPNNCIKLIKSMKDYVTNEEIMFIIDGKKYICDEDELFVVCKKLNYQIYVNEDNRGLSYSRNFAMEICNNAYLIFLDDDVQFICNTFERYKYYFSKGYNIGGAKLIFPEGYSDYIKWLPNGYSYLFGVHSIDVKPWGACFGYSVDIAKEHNLTFNPKLGRLGKGLQSGDDTTFIQEYTEYVRKQFFIDDAPLYHCFELKRFKMRYILKRIYWQGRSEIRRNNFVNGIKKEWHRSSLKNNNIAKFLIGKELLMVFLFGCLCEIFSVKENK